MAKTIIAFSTLLLTSLVVGTMFGIWLGYNPADKPATLCIAQQQRVIGALNTVMPILGATCILFTLVYAALVRHSRQSFYLLITGAVFLLVAGLVTRFFNQPINSLVITWNAQTPPSNWMVLRDTWWR